MATDPWGRPTLHDLKTVIESFEKLDGANSRNTERIELAVPAEITTRRGNLIPAMTREISRYGVGLLHKGSLNPGDVRLKMASETREYTYSVAIEWCTPVENGMFISGGRFLGKPEVSDVEN
ncbi:hypothetical protein Plim_0210 [Planctopirus limnophila DSM 3776]|uniref:PilZ domain-containing protein n=3 Tax=Planctopirus TaxID=1649480 RepID=D5SND5_PLAL2|nr:MULTISPECIES: PilZ domain-containing protein [Planctopirus]ADG66062.1 hypothetical protein Plim_0210 [Planctopirus limnophila DSM 3776]ODA34820.1 hypothetical protein A6X21_03960 [Planctopirus hydrillae]QDV29102.1 hypothetical protein Spb1_09710 [Planctopirus ephydatiae]